MKFDTFINNLLKEDEITKAERLNALKKLNSSLTNKRIPESYRKLVDILKREPLETLQSSLELEKRMHYKYNNSNPFYIRALELAIEDYDEI